MTDNIFLLTSDSEKLLFQIMTALQTQTPVKFELIPGTAKAYILRALSVELTDFHSVSTLFYWLGYYTRMYRE